VAASGFWNISPADLAQPSGPALDLSRLLRGFPEIVPRVIERSPAAPIAPPLLSDELLPRSVSVSVAVTGAAP